MRRPLSILAVAAFSVGCVEELGPLHSPTASVSGRVTVGGRPVSGGFVEFLPIDGTVGRLRSVAIEPDGSFVTDRVAVGLNGVRVVGIRPHDRRIFPLTQSHAIRRTIDPGAETRIELELLTEAARAADPGRIR